MRTLRKETVTHAYYMNVLPENDNMENNKVYISIEYKVAKHKCLCGCGNISVTPLKDTEWKIIGNEDIKLTMKPSILNNNCPNRSHYIITNGIANFV